jgi:alcohol dehydrogenase (cytochrome c)
LTAFKIKGERSRQGRFHGSARIWSRAAGGNVIVALDAATGKEGWRFHVIARPGEPGGNSWNGLPLDKRNGASVWIPGSYDAELNLAYFGPAQTYDTAPLRNPNGQPGASSNPSSQDGRPTKPQKSGFCATGT